MDEEFEKNLKYYCNLTLYFKKNHLQNENNIKINECNSTVSNIIIYFTIGLLICFLIGLLVGYLAHSLNAKRKEKRINLKHDDSDRLETGPLSEI